MKTKLFFITSLLLVGYAAAACGNQTKETSPALSGEQELICNLIVKMYGHPEESFGVMDIDNISPIYARSDDFVENHCSSELQKFLRDRYADEWTFEDEDPAIGYFTDYFGAWGEDTSDAFYDYHATECIYITHDWYTYVFYEFGRLGCRRVKAHAEGETAIIDKVDTDYGGFLDDYGVSDEEEWIRAGWYCKDKDDELWLFSPASCVIVDFTSGEPSWQKYKYEIKGNKVIVSLLNNQEIVLNKESDSVLKQEGVTTKTWTKIVGEPVIIIEE